MSDWLDKLKENLPEEKKPPSPFRQDLDEDDWLDNLKLNYRPAQTVYPTLDTRGKMPEDDSLSYVDIPFIGPAIKNAALGMSLPASSGLKALGAELKGLADTSDKSNNPNVNSSLYRTIGGWASDLGDYIDESAKEHSERYASRLSSPEYADKGITDILSDPELRWKYLTDPRGAAADLSYNTGNMLFFAALSRLFPQIAATNLASKALTPASGLFGKIGMNKAEQLLGSEAAKNLLGSSIQFGATMGPAGSLINAGTIVDALKEQGKSDREISSAMNSLILEELPADIGFAALTGPVIRGKLAGLAGRNAPTWQKVLAQGTGIPLEAAGGYYSNVNQMILADEYSGKPYGTLFDPTPNEAVAGRHGVMAGILPSIYGTYRGVRNEQAADELYNQKQRPSIEYQDRYNKAREQSPEFARQGYRDAAALRDWADRQSGGVMSDEVFNYIVQVANEMGLPPQRLLATAFAESDGNIDIEDSPASAIGIMQLTPETAESLGVDPRDWKQNVRGGAIYLKQMYDQFGDWDLAHAAYNAGPNAVKRYGGIPPYSETQHYVERINNRHLSNAPEFGGEVEQSDEGVYRGENGGGRGKYWNVQSDATSFDGAQPGLLDLTDMLGKHYFDETGLKLIVNHATDGAHPSNGSGRGHSDGFKIDVQDAGEGGVGMNEDGPLFTADFQPGPFLQKFIEYGRSLGVGMNVEGLGTPNVHLDISMVGDQWDGNGESLGGFNPKNAKGKSYSVQPAADSIYASKVRDAMRTPEQQKESANPPFEIKSSYDTSREIIERFARERAQKAVDEGDAETASFLHGMFDGDNFQNTKKNVTALENRYGEELTAFATGILAQSQQGTAQAQEQQAQPAQKSVQPNEPPKPKPAQSKQGNKFLRNEPVLQAANEHIAKLRQSSNQDDQLKAATLQNAVNNKTLAEVEGLLKQYGLSTTPAQSQQQQSQPQSQPENVVQNNTTPENVSPQPQTQSQQQTQPKKKLTEQEKRIKQAGINVPKKDVDRRKKQAKAIIELAKENGLEISEADEKKLTKGDYNKTVEWRGRLIQAGIINPQSTKQSSQQTQPTQQETQPQEETPQQPQPTLEERLNQVVQDGVVKAGQVWERIKKDFKKKGYRTKYPLAMNAMEPFHRGETSSLTPFEIETISDLLSKTTPDTDPDVFFATLERRLSTGKPSLLSEKASPQQSESQQEPPPQPENPQSQPQAEPADVETTTPKTQQQPQPQPPQPPKLLTEGTPTQEPRREEWQERPPQQPQSKQSEQILLPERTTLEEPQPETWQQQLPQQPENQRTEQSKQENEPQEQIPESQQQIVNIRNALELPALPTSETNNTQPQDIVEIAMGEISENENERKQQGNALVQLLNRPQFIPSGKIANHIDALKRTLAQGHKNAIVTAQNFLVESVDAQLARKYAQNEEERAQRESEQSQQPQPEPPTEPTEPTQPETQPEPPSQPQLEPTPPGTRTEPQSEEPPTQNAKQTYTRKPKGDDTEIIAGRKAILAAPAGTQVKTTDRQGNERRYVVQQDEKGRRTFQALDENGNPTGKAYALSRTNATYRNHFHSSDIMGIELSKYEPQTEDKGNGTETATTQTAPNTRTQENNNQNPESGQTQAQPEVTEQRNVTADDVNYRFRRWQFDPANKKDKGFKTKNAAGKEILKRMNDPDDPLTPNEAVAEFKKAGIELPDVQRPKEQKPTEQPQQQKPEPKPEPKVEREEPKTEPEQRPAPLEPNEFTPLFEVKGNTVTLKENPTKLTDSELSNALNRIARNLNATTNITEDGTIIKATFNAEFKDDKSDKTKIRDYFILKASKFLKDNADETKAKPQEKTKPEKETQPEPQKPKTVQDTGRTGNTAEVITASRKAHKIRYRVVEADELISSHSIEEGGVVVNKNYPSELQPRDRSRVDMQAQVTRMANDLNPADLLEVRDVNQGAPVIRSDGVVLNGNGRTMAIRAAYANNQEHGKGDAYKAALVKNAKKLGLNANEIKQMNQPVLVRELTHSLSDDELKDLITSQTGGARYGASEQAQADAAKIKSSTLQEIPQRDGDIDLTAAYSRDFLRSALIDIATQDELTALTDKDGNISPDGITRVKRALFALAYGDETIIATMSESTDNSILGVTNALIAAAPTMAQVQLGIKNGSLHKYNLKPVMDAVRRLKALRDEGKSVAQYLSSQSMFADYEDSTESKEILSFLDRNKRSPKKITAFLNELAKNIQKQGNPNQGELFGKTEPAPLMKLIQRAMKVVEGAEQKPQEKKTTALFAVEAGADTETMNPVTDEKLNPVQKAVKNFCKRINVSIVFFKGDPKFHGKFENGVVYLNVDSPISPDWVFHHEIGHWLAVNNPELFNQLVQMLNITDEQRNAHRKKTGQWQLDDDEVDAEILSNKFGDIAQLEGFFKDLAKKDSSLIDRAIRWMKDMLDKFTDFFFKKENGLTRSQRKNLYDRLGKIASRIVDEHGERRYRYNRETHAIEYMDGTPLPALPRTKANDPNIIRFSTAANSNSQESFSQRIRNKAAAFFNSDKPQRYKEEITKALSQVSKYRIMYGYTDDENTDVVVDNAHKVITARHAYQWEKLLPTVGEKIAQELGLNPTDDMSRYIADWLMTGALNNNSQQAKDFAAAMRSNPAQAELLQRIRDTFQKMADMSPQEKILSTIVDKEEKKSFLQKLKGKMTKEELLDDLAPLEAAVQRMVENAPPAVAKFIKENVDPYKMARLLKGKGAIADMMIGHDDMTESDMEKIRTALSEVFPNVNFADFQSLGMIIKSVGGDARGLEAYAIAKLDKEIHERNREVDANGKPKYKFIEPSFEESDDDQVINDGKAKFDAAQQALVNFSNTLAAIQYTSGLKTQDQFYSLINGLKNYVPMERVFQEDEVYTTYDSAAKKEGSKRDTYSPLQRLAANAHVLLKQAERNKVKLEIASLARLGNFGDVFVEVPKRANRENIITFKEGGVTKYLETPDMGIVRAVESMQSKGDSNVIMTALKIATSFMRAAQTVRNLDFIAGNPARDLPDAYIHNKHLSMNPIRALVQVWKAGFKGVVTKDQDYYDFLAYGGAQSGFVSESSDSTARAINAIGQGERWDRYKGKHGLKGIFSQMWRDLETFAERSEYVTRLNTYKAAKAALAEQHGGTATKTDKSLAALQARSATVDFARAGHSVRSANQVVLFLNAAIQGLALWGEKLTPKKLKTKEGRRAVYSAAFRLAMMGILPAVVQAAANYSDDDRYKLYKNRPNWEKEMYWIFGDGVRVPKGMDVGIRLVSTMTEETMDWLFKNDPIEAKRIGAAFVNGFPSLTSTIFTPALESTVNYSIFRDAPIVPTKDQHLPDAMQYGLHTSKTAKFIGGLIDFSPRKIDYLISNYLGFMGKFASKVPNYVSDGSIPIDEMPMVRRYMFDPERNPKIVQDYYEALGEQESIYRGWQEARKRGLKSELPEEYDRRLHAHLKSVQEPMRNISNRERRIMDDPKLTSDQRKEKLRELERKRVALCERALGKAR